MGAIKSTCKRCGRPLIMTPGGDCRACGKHANMFRAAGGKTTCTRKGTRRVAAKHNATAAATAQAERARARKAREECKAAEARARAVHARQLAESRYAHQSDVARRVADGEQLTWAQAEILVCEWMRGNGYPDASVTASGADLGVDVRSTAAIAQVKHHARAISREKIQQLVGVARVENRRALFFSLGGYTRPAVTWANENGVALYEYLPVRQAGSVDGRAKVEAAPASPDPMSVSGVTSRAQHLRIGLRVRIHAWGLRGKTGTIVKQADADRYDVALDNSRLTVRFIHKTKLTPF